MADELTLTASLSFAKGNQAAFTVSESGKKFTVSGSAMINNVQNIGTSEEAILLGDTGGAGYCFFKNLDNTNFVNLKVGTGGAIFAKLKPKEFALFRLGSGASAPYAIADTAACNLQVTLISD